MIHEKLLAVCPNVIAALLLLARSLCESLGLPALAVTEILAATKASRSTAYELVQVIVDLLPTLARARGRPPKPPLPMATAGALPTRAVLAFVMRNPGCVHRSETRMHYSDGFRRFVVELRAEYTSLNTETFAAAVEVPLGTLGDWLCAPPAQEDAPATTAPARTLVMSAQMQTVIDAWSRWDGTFGGFCEHARAELRVPFGRELISLLLEVNGVRRRSRRPGRSPDELALRGAFRTFFPGAQWVGDGMQVPVTIDGTRFVFNLELDVDAHTAALTGASLRDEEDATAVVQAFDDGCNTTGAAPIALLLDNKPSNHTQDVEDALDDTLRIRATVQRPQNKAHVEGAFGLFSQRLPDLVLDTQDGAHALAKAFLRAVVQVWARTTNHRPRADRGGRSRVELYAEQPTEEQIEEARRELRSTADRQELARRTLEARRRPEVLALLDANFARLGLLDPECHIRLAIAAYPLDAIVDGIAIFEGKQLAKTLPEGADARYLLGIVRNVAAQTEGDHIARRLFDLRLQARDQMLVLLVAARDAVCADVQVDRVVAGCVDHALATESPLERGFWIGSLADIIRSRDQTERDQLYARAVRRIEATYAVPPRERHDAVRRLADRVVVLV